MLENLKELVNDEQMINSNDSEATMSLKGLRINAKVMDGEEITKIFEDNIVR